MIRLVRQGMEQFADEQDTIAAISTPPGEGGVAIVRISGPQAIRVADSVFSPGGKKQDLADTPSHSLRYGWVADPRSQERIDEVLVSVMRAPHTFTGEDVVEINCHGGRLVSRRILEIVLAEGTRLAAAGEFTRRAFLNGRLDLAQAEAVADVIRAGTDQALKAAVRHLSGDLGRQVRELREELLDLLAQIEVEVDFPEEDVPAVSLQKIIAGLSSLRSRIEHLYRTAQYGRILREGVGTAIVGRPNVGKSSLLNRLLKMERAIVTEEPGTTRDVIEEAVNLRGVMFRLMDTAGLRDATAKAEMIGIERARSALDEADLILFVVDASQPLTGEDKSIISLLGGKRGLLVLNKADLPLALAPEDFSVLDWPWVETSMFTGQGMDVLETRMVEMVTSKETSELAVTNVRHQAALKRCIESLDAALATLREGWPADLTAVDLQSALDALGEITGESVDTEVVDRIFARFCVGK